MYKILYIFFFALIVSNCSFKKVVKHHGIPFLEKKQKQLIIDQSTSNDIREILGTPSTRSKFDNDVWIYIERKQTQSELKNLGRMIIFKNDLLVLDIDDNFFRSFSIFFQNINGYTQIQLSKPFVITKVFLFSELRQFLKLDGMLTLFLESIE